jgi:membrane protease YdiL (CAAX protease family)
MNIVLVMEGALLLIATIWSQLAEIQLTPHLIPDWMHLLMGIAVGVALASLSSLLFWLGKFPAFKVLAGLRELVLNELAPVFAHITLADVIVIAIASGFCEEIMFRGVLQDQFGLLGASFMFGIMHSPSFRYPQYGIWAFAAGILLGLLYQSTNTLWTPIFAHIINNVLGLLVLRWIGIRQSASNV